MPVFPAMSRKVCDTWFYAIIVASVAAALYYYYPEIQERFPQETAILESYSDNLYATIQGGYPVLPSMISRAASPISDVNESASVPFQKRPDHSASFLVS